MPPERGPAPLLQWYAAQSCVRQASRPVVPPQSYGPQSYLDGRSFGGSCGCTRGNPIRGRVASLGEQCDQHGKRDQQRQIARGGRFPGQLAEPREIAERFHRYGGAEGHDGGNAGQSEKFRRADGHHVAQQNGDRTYAFGAGSKDVRARTGPPTTNIRTAMAADGRQSAHVEAAPARRETAEPRHTTEASASAKASAHPPPTPAAISSRVTGSRAAINSPMGRCSEGEMPKSPCRAAAIWRK